MPKLPIDYPTAPDTAFVPEEYLTMRQAVYLVGGALHKATWTSRERLTEIGDLEERMLVARMKKVRERRLAWFRKLHSRDWRGPDDIVPDGDLPALSPVEMKVVSSDVEAEFATELESRQRYREVIAWLRGRLHAGAVEAKFLVASGNLYDMPREFWASDQVGDTFEHGRAKFHPGIYGWHWSPTAPPLSGRVLVSEKSLDAEFRGPDANQTVQESPDRAPGRYSLKRLREWYEGWVASNQEAGKIPSRDDDWAAARHELSDGVTRDAVRQLRNEMAPEIWRKVGRRKTGDV